MVMGVMGGMGLLICAVAIYGTTRAAANGSVPRNVGAGIRTGLTQSSDEAWVAAHRAAMQPATVLTWVSVAFGVALIVAGAIAGGVGGSAVVIVLFVVGYAVVLGGSWWIVRVANRAALGVSPFGKP